MSTHKIPLSQGLFATVDEVDYERVNQHKWTVAKRGRNTYAYRMITLPSASVGKGKLFAVYLHRFIMGIIAEKKMVVDHIDHDGLNCTRENMRITDQSGNLQNSRISKNNTSGFKGVKYMGGRRKKHWVAEIMANRKRIGLGYFLTPEEAALAYKTAAEKLHGEFACTG